LTTRWSSAWAAGLLLTLLVGGGVAQDSGGPALISMRALENGSLNIWVIRQAVPKRKDLQIAALHHATPLTYTEQTTGNFGQSATTFGQTAGSYGVSSSSPTIAVGAGAPGVTANSTDEEKAAAVGYAAQTSGSFGQTSGSYGTAASDHGQTASSLGQTSSTYGTSASNHGQTAGSFGNSLSTIADAGNAASQAKGDPIRTASLEFEERLRRAFPGLQVKYTDVPSNELGDDLRAARGSKLYPDVLVGPLPAEWWTGWQQEYGVALLRPAMFVDDGLQSARSQPEVALLARAPHAVEARAFVLWLNDDDGVCLGCGGGVDLASVGAEGAKAADVAKNAIGQLLNGESLGDQADPAMADFSPLLSQGVLLTTANGLAGDADLQVENVSVNGKLAAVAMRVMVSSEKAFGAAHPLLVLRKDDDGQWRVLHVSLNLPVYEQQTVRKKLMDSAPPDRADGGGPAVVEGVSLASPLDGEKRQVMPELWWDNKGGAGLQVVEWQIYGQGGLADPQLFLVPDGASRLRTRTVAGFMNTPAKYRWRVWSVGAEGETKISPWRSVVIVAR